MSPIIPGRGNMDDFFKYGAQRVSTPENLNSELPPVQNFAFGGIANPSQRAMLRGSDRSYLEARQKELDAFEQQRLAYNAALQDWQTNVYNPYVTQVNAYNAAADKYNADVYNPYKQQVDAYNAALEKYNAEVYNPYKTQFDVYEKAVNDWNAGDRTSDYAGPSAPTLARSFDMTAPTAPKAFEMTAPTAPKDFSGVAPVLPFKEEDVKAYQQAAADRARKDASNRAVAIDVVSNPDQFNFGSMSVAHRFMAEGGEVMDDSHDKTARSIIKDFEGYGYTPEEMMKLADEVAAAGRGGDELLAYLSPESVEYLRKHGGSGTINPMTGLPEFKGGIIGGLVDAIKDVFRPSRREQVAEPVALPVEAANPASDAFVGPRTVQEQQAYEDARKPVPTAADLMKQLDAANAANAALQTKYDTDLSTFKTQAQKDQEAAVAAALKADAEKRAATIAAPVIGTQQAATPATSTAAPGTAASMLQQVGAQQVAASTPSRATLTPEIARDLMQRSMTTGVPTAEFDKYGGYGAVSSMYNQGGGTYSLSGISQSDLQRYANTVAQTGVGNLSVLAQTGTPITAQALENMRKNGIDPSTISNAASMYSPANIANTAKAYNAQSVANRATGPATSLPGQLSLAPSWTSTPSLSGGSATGLSAYSGIQPLDMSAFFKKMPSANWDSSSGKGVTAGMNPQQGGQEQQSMFSTGDISSTPMASNVPSYVDYTSRGVGSAINNVAMPTFNIGQAKQYVSATNPNNYFAAGQPSRPGISPGTTALGPADMPLYGAMNTMNAIGSSPNLSPTMLGGAQNAGIMYDRMGNRIYSPGLPPFGFAKGGGVDVSALMAQNAETLSDEQPEESINTNPVGTAQQYLADLSGNQERTEYALTPNRIAVKRTRSSQSPGGTAKEMAMQYESLTKGDLGAMKDFKPKIKDTDSARAQLEDMARQYKIKLRSIENKAKGLASDTFGAPTLEAPTLMKNSLAKKRFEKGGEAKKEQAGEGEPSLFGVSDYATRAAERMFPNQSGQDDQRDAARHMLAAGIVARKYGPGTAEFLGKAHERLSNPYSFFNMFGIGEPRYDYNVDVHNNRIGAELAARSKSQQELEALVRQMAMQAQNKQTPGKPWTMTKEQLEAVDAKNKKAATPPEYRADGSPKEGEVSDAELEAASRPAFVTPKSGKGRKEGEISRQLKSGEAYVNMAKGVTELPYDLVGAPVDLATMVMRPFGYSTDKPVMGSDWIKEKMTGAGIRPAPPADPTSKGFYTAGEMLSNLTNPAGVARKVGPVVEKGVKAGATEVGRQLDRAIMDNAGPLANLVPQAAKPLYAVRPTGSTVLSGPVGFNKEVSKVDEMLGMGKRDARGAVGDDEDKVQAIRDFWDKKGRNYFVRQFGTPDDPVAAALAKKQIRSSSLEEMFPEYLIDQLAVGKTRVNDQGQTRFFPKYPRAMEDFTKRYDEATGLRGNVITQNMGNPEYEYLLTDAARNVANMAGDAQADKLLAQGVRPELINTNVAPVGRSAKNPERVIGDGTNSAKELLGAYEEATAYSRMTPAEQKEWANTQFGAGRPLHGLDYPQVGENILPQNIRTAIDRGEPVYDIGNMQKPLKGLLNPTNINEYLATLPTREIVNMRFEDAVRGAAKLTDNKDRMATMVERIKAGKPVADTVFSQGVSAPLLQIKEGPLDGFAWKRIEKREATVPEGAYVGHSVGGYETGGPTYTADKREGFNTGKWQVYTLRDNRNRPVNTIEVKMVDENTPVVTQIKGNGRATGNTAPEKYDTAVLEFLQNYLKPAAIEESNTYLTPLLQTYKQQLGTSPRMR